MDAEPHADADAEAEYAGELVALAARELTRQVDGLPHDQQPTGWLTDDAPSEAMLPAPSALLAPGGRFEEIAFFGHQDHPGYVTEAIDHGGNAVYRIDLPEKIWGGNPLAEIEYAASAKFSRKPVTEESVRAQWEAERARAERWRQQQAEWDRAGSQRALPAVDMSESLTGEAADPGWKPCLCGPDEYCDECEPGGRLL